MFLTNLAEWHRTGGDTEECEPLYRRALDILSKSSPGEPRVADLLMAMASLYAGQGRTQAAEKLLLRALTVREQTRGRDSAEYADVQRKLAAVYRLQKRNTEADRVEREIGTSFR
jgi:tetratricopeptide (TPR) repeat protein